MAVRDSTSGASRDAPTVRVLGAASIRVEPDEAFVWLTLTALDSSAGEALRDVAARNTALARLLDAADVPRTDRSSGGITVGEQVDHTQHGMRPLGQRATATTVVRLVDSEQIGAVIVRATTELDARVQGPSWRVSPSNPAWLRAATLAATVARDKAAAYAAGVGARLGRLVSLSEPSEHFAPQGLRMARAAGGGDLHVDAGEHEVAATVWAEFELGSEP